VSNHKNECAQGFSEVNLKKGFVIPKLKGQGQSTSDPESSGGTFKHRMGSITQSHKSPQISHSKFALSHEAHGNLVSLCLPVTKFWLILLKA